MRNFTGGYRIGYVVVEWNQASSQPRIVGDDVFDRLDDVRDVRDQLREETSKVGRRERHTIGVLIEPEDEVSNA